MNDVEGMQKHSKPLSKIQSKFQKPTFGGKQEPLSENKSNMLETKIFSSKFEFKPTGAASNASPAEESKESEPRE
jgi:hypothetical protein